jgi:hypothetical protein
MYRLRLHITPRGVEPTVLQTDKKDRNSLEPLAFYAKLEKDIETFKTRVNRVLGLQGRKAKNGKPNL